jgi:NAD(P)H-hydrate epimerase
MKLVSVSEMKETEAAANARGISYEQMMQNAGIGLARYIISNYGNERKAITGLVGTGNNGGDTLVALAALAKSGWQARAYIVKSRPSGDPMMKWLQQVGGVIVEGGKDHDRKILSELLTDSSLILDGVLGTGIKLPLKPELAEILGFVSKFSDLPDVIAVDCPSGVDCDSGAAATECIPAKVTVCMAAVKQGLVRFPANNYVGKIEVIDIGINEMKTQGKKSRYVVNAEMVRNVLPARPKDAHKGIFGTILIVAGSVNYVGAAFLAGNGAYRVGSGLVRLGVIQPLQLALAGHMPESVWMILPSEGGVISADAAEVVLDNLDHVDAILIGPGLGTEETTQKFFEKLLIGSKSGKKAKGIGFVADDSGSEKTVDHSLPPMVIDADGLRMLAKIQDWQKKIPSRSILTPHPGEMAAMTGLKVEEIQVNRETVASKYSTQWGHIVVLKGALTVIADPDGRTAIIPVATSALAKAGTGDILAGMICGLRGQGMDAFIASYTGAWLHAQAGLITADKFGSEMTIKAKDILNSIPDAIKSLR